MKDVEIIKFRTAEEYKLWLDEQSWHVQEKAAKFRERFGDILPVVLVVNADTCSNCWGPDAVVHIFINPAKLEEVLNNVVFDEEDP